MLHYRSKLYTERNSELEDRGEERNGTRVHGTGEIPKRGKKIFRSGLVLFLFAAGLFGACELLETDPPGEQPLYFEYTYMNHAWGFQHHGWLIDGDGFVRRFNLPEDFRTPDSTGYLSLEDLEYNLGQTDSVIDIVESSELDTYIRLIPGAADGEIGERTNAAADAGASVLAAYLYDPDRDLYEYIFLGQSGDWEQFNEAPEAESLVDWLREYGVFWLSE